uniref:Uncharacterized protein n=1 Tax=Arundo donax TaxID=35708 RepID=A0A0A9BF57_ARUDO
MGPLFHPLPTLATLSPLLPSLPPLSPCSLRLIQSRRILR